MRRTPASRDASPPAASSSATDARDPVAALDEQLAATERVARALVGPLTPAQFNWRPAPGRWSVGEHLAHLNLVDASYLPHLDAMLALARAAAPAREPARPPRLAAWLGAWLVRETDAPVRLKVRTPPQLAPAAGSGAAALDPAAVLGEFAAGRRALRERLARAAAVDLDRIRRRYAPGLGPARFLVLTLGQWFALTAAHDRRHLWSAGRVTEAARFPADGGRDAGRAASPTS